MTKFGFVVFAGIITNAKIAQYIGMLGVMQ